mmetsp:Transcript_500/g.1112  ORF Transcript_500/g.1112 Transcript_500/m.1112 type:complete len:214 (+) Transcript_500:751-1392(+)
MEARQRDELPHEAGVAQLVGEALHLLVRHAGRVPVEAGRQVVREHLVWELALHRAREVFSLRQDRLRRLHPQQVGVRSIRLGACDGELDAVVQTVVTLARTGCFPIEERHLVLAAQHPRGLLLHPAERRLLLLDELVPLLAHIVDLLDAHRAELVQPLSTIAAESPLLQRTPHHVREGLQPRGAHPLVAHRVHLRHWLALLACGRDDVVEGGA